MPIVGKLGAKASRPEQRCKALQLADYIDPAQLPPLVPATNFRAKYLHPQMYLNDHEGDCTCASKAHIKVSWAANSGRTYHVTDKDVHDAYYRINGGADNGATLIDALDDDRKNGLAGDKLTAYAALNTKNFDHWRYGTQIFGGVYAGVQLPQAWQGMSVWDVQPGTKLSGQYEPGSWGGHCVPALDFDAQGVWVATWGSFVHVSWRAIKYYFFESYVLLDNLWFIGDKSVSGFDAAMLEWNMKYITGQNPGPKPAPVIPPPQPIPPAPVDPTPTPTGKLKITIDGKPYSGSLVNIVTG